MNDYQPKREKSIYAEIVVCPLCFGCGFCSKDRDGNFIPLEGSKSINNRLRGVHHCPRCDYWIDRMAKVRG